MVCQVYVGFVAFDHRFTRPVTTILEFYYIISCITNVKLASYCVLCLPESLILYFQYSTRDDALIEILTELTE